jgi:hypothetical protein
MTLPYYKVYNCFPSFGSTFIQNGVVTPNPLPNYGSMGDHLQDYFDNRMGETPAGGVGNLVAFLGSEKSLTSIHQDSLTGMANNLSTSYGITTGTVGYALLDFRGDSWKYLVGDGIIGPSNMTNSPIYDSVKSSAVSILNHFNNQYPNIKWSYAGLPNIPQFTTFAPTAGSSFSWSPSLTNSGITNSHWDASHPTGPAYGEVFSDWEHTPTELKTFYKNQSINRVKDILDVSGWMCPDINPTISALSTFGYFMFPLKGLHIHTREVVSSASDYSSSQNREFRVMPLVCSLYRSRESHVFDSALTGSGAYFTNMTYAEGASGTVLEVYNGFTGNTVDAADDTIPESAMKAGMLEPAAFAGADGFVYQDQMPILIDLACTGATQADDRMTQAVSRARKYISNTVYGTNNISTIPWTTRADEVKGYISYNVTAKLLTTISESIPVGDPSWKILAAENGVKTPDESEGVTGYRSAYWESNSPSTEPQQFTTPSQSLVDCLCTPPKIGACCKDDGCADNVSDVDCSNLGGSFEENTLCSALSNTTGCAPFCECCTRTGCAGRMTMAQCISQGGGCVSKTIDNPDGICNTNPNILGGVNCCVNKNYCLVTCTGPTVECPSGKTCRRYYLADYSCKCQDTDNDGEIDPDLRITCPPIACGAKCLKQCDTLTYFEGILHACCSNDVCLNSNSNAGVCQFFGCPDTGCRDSCATPPNPILPPSGGTEWSANEKTQYFLNNLDIDMRTEVIEEMTNIFGYEIISAENSAGIMSVTSVTQPFRQKSAVLNSLNYYMQRLPNENVSYMNLIQNYKLGLVGSAGGVGDIFQPYNHNIVARIQSEFAFDRFLLLNSYA